MNSSHVSLSPRVPEFEHRGRHARFGLIALATDLTSERDLFRILSGDGVSIHATRVAFENPTTPENLRKMAPHLTAAADLIAPGEELKAVCYSCTAASVMIGDEEIAAAIKLARPGVPVVTPTASARMALTALGARRIAVLTPYLEKTSRPMEAYFTEAGFTVTRMHCFGVEDDRDMARITVSSIVEGALAADTDDAEALFVSCTALQAVDAIAEIERRTGKPVVTSNQASAWVMSNVAGLPNHRPSGYGRLFDQPLANFTLGEAV
ncbi:MAG: ectoine utilization protein EutA [Roseibium sp.]|uniref:aspartate racemase/maleate isomerase family protein n=1 Tax=Roseibium sp. TaxID=1936156 RepID=UPI002610DBEF|nr:ectoine utilization protein EutA [Roseibium sp.]MCV0424234.1 ectoine utilization protein EutA [Roseibium sp.]